MHLKDQCFSYEQIYFLACWRVRLVLRCEIKTIGCDMNTNSCLKMVMGPSKGLLSTNNIKKKKKKKKKKAVTFGKKI